MLQLRLAEGSLRLKCKNVQFVVICRTMRADVSLLPTTRQISAGCELRLVFVHSFTKGTF